MGKNNIRTKYIKSLIDEKEHLNNILEESTKDSLNSLLDDKVYQNLRRVLSESEENDEDSFEVEEVNPEEPIIDTETEEAESEETDDIAPECENGDEDCDTQDSDVWDEVEDCKDADGEYDLRGKDINTVLKLIQTMDPDEGVRIIKNSDDTALVQPDNDETEFEIDIASFDEPNAFEGEIDGELGDNEKDDDFITVDFDLDDIESDDNEKESDGNEIESKDDDTEFGLEIDNNDKEEEEAMYENLGYTTNYQSKTAMTMPSDNDGGDSRFDKGAPKGGANNKKRWVGSNGKDGGNPYSETVNETEECLFELELNDEMPVEEAHNIHALGREHNSVADQRSADSDTPNDDFYRNVKHGDKKQGTARQNFNESRELANLRRKTNAIIKENEELKEIAKQIKDKLMEAAVVNSSLSKIIRLITENSTTRNEKLNIVNRFNNVSSISESRALYETISKELKNAHAINNDNLLNNQLTEVKSNNNNMIVETKMLQQSDGIKAIQDFQERMSKIK